MAAIASTEANAQGTVDAIASENLAEARAYGVDVSDLAAVEETAKRILGDMGGANILVNNAGITKDNILLRMSEEEFDRVIQVNLRGTFNTCRVFGRSLMKAASARIVNVSSIVAIEGNPGQANYAASKAGILGFTRALAKELASREVTVNAVAPGMIETDMTANLGEVGEQFRLRVPLQRVGKPEEIAHAVAFLCEDGAAYITGHTLVVDGGFTI